MTPEEHLLPRAELSWHLRAQTRRLSLRTGRRVKFIVSGKSNARLSMPASLRPKLLDDTLGAKLLVVGTYLIFNPWWALFAAQLPVYFVEIHRSEPRLVSDPPDRGQTQEWNFEALLWSHGTPSPFQTRPRRSGCLKTSSSRLQYPTTSLQLQHLSTVSAPITT